MRIIRHFFVVLLLGVLSACGGGGTIGGTDNGSGTTTSTVALGLTDQTGASVSRVTRLKPLTIKATVKTNGVAASGKLVTFKLNDTSLAAFDNDAGTAQTNADGVASIGLKVGSKSGAGTITASLSTGESATITFESAGDSAVNDVLTISLSLKNAAGQTVTALSNAQPVTIHAQINSSLGISQANKLITFAMSNTSLASFANGTGTAQTNATGLATLGLSVGSVSGSGELTATLSSGETAKLVFDSAGDKPTENYNLRLSLVDVSGNDSVTLSKLQPLKLIGVLTSPKGLSVKNQLVSFTVNDPTLAEFGATSGTALTSADGVVQMSLNVGTKSGSGTVTAAVGTTMLATQNFNSAGDKQTSDSLTMTMTLKDNTGLETSAVSNAKPLTVAVQVVSKLGVNQAGKLVTFVLNDKDLGFFSNAAGTAETDANGIARITLSAGTKSGAGLVTASISSPAAQSVQKTFTSAGDGGLVDSKPVGSIVLYSDKLALGTGVNDKVALTALVRDRNNVLMKDVKVQFSADNDGVLQVESDVTGVDGTAKAFLSSKSNYTLRDIVVTATAGSDSLKQHVTIQVVGNTLSIASANTIVLNSEMELSFALLDSEGRGIPDVQLQLVSSLGNTFSTATPRTDLIAGRVKVKYKALVAGAGTDRITVSALGVSSTKAIEINPDEFAFTSAATDIVEIPLNTAASQSVLWKRNSAPVVNSGVRFVSTRGAVAATAGGLGSNAVTDTTTDSTGTATVFLRSSQSGLALIAAESTSATPAITTSRLVEFIATDASKVEVQAVPAQIATGESSTIQAVVRDALNNPVKNKTIVFSLENSFGGQLSPVTSTTNSQGIATTTFTADTTTPGSGNPGNVTGLRVKAALVTNEAISGTGTVSVGQRTLFFRFGTGNKVETKQLSLYSKQFAVLVTDASGNAVPNQSLNVAVYPKLYSKGIWARYPVTGSFKRWLAVRSTTAANDCGTEDINRNGILDTGEDANNDGQLTPGNVVSVERVITANSEGIAYFNLVYPREYAPWVDIQIVVSGAAGGTENQTYRDYTLDVLSDDVTDETVLPPANPWGYDAPFDETTNTFTANDFCTIP